MIVAIDGPAGSGKSTVAHAIAERRKLTYLDTGAMYRAVTLLCLRRGVDLNNFEAVAREARNCSISFGHDGKTQTVLANGQDVTKEIRTAEVDRNVSVVSAIPAVREAMVAQQRELGATGNVVAEGRDIGTVVFPNADVKVFLTADASARAHRRAVQREGSETPDPADEQQILDDIVRRDKLDSARETSPLRMADDAHPIDSSSMGIEEVVSAVEELMDDAEQHNRLKSDDNNADKSIAEEKPVNDSRGAVSPQGTANKSASVSNTSAPHISDKKSSGTRTSQEKMRAFNHNSFDDYFDHGVASFPLPARVLRSVVICVAGFFSKLFWRWEVLDGQRFWQGGPGRVIVMNHASMLDPVAVICSGWFHKIPVRALYKSEFDDNKLVNWVFSRCGGIPVDREKADLRSLRRAQWALERGESVLVFPEGTRIRSDEQPVEIHGGFAFMARHAKAKILPMAIVGARDITPFGSHIKHFPKVWMAVGEPIDENDVHAKRKREQLQELEDLSMRRVYELRDTLRRAHPGLH